MVMWRRSPVALACVVCALLSADVRAAGFLFYEVGTPEVGLASAGVTARASSPSTLLGNPAGLTRLDGTQVQVASVLAYGHLQFSPDSQTDAHLGTNNGGNVVGLLPSGGAFASFAPWHDVWLGVGLFTNFGAPQSWEPAWLGRYYTTKSTLIGISLMPAVAWRINDTFSVGATINTMYGYLKQVVAVQNIEPQTPDGTLTVSSGTLGIGGNAGVLYTLSPATRFGATYTLPVKLNFSSKPGFSGVGPGLSAVLAATGLDTATLDLGMKVPQTFTFGFFHALGDRWAIMGDAGWQNWAAFGAVEVGITTSVPRGITTAIAFRDTWHVGLGAQVQLAPTWLLNFGAAYDSSMTDDASRSLSLSLASQWRWGIGAQVAVDPHWSLGFASELLWGGSPVVDVDRGPLAGHVSGSYANTWILFLSFGFSWKA